MKKIVSLLLICLCITACGAAKFKTIDTNEALPIIESGATLIDVRTVEEYNREHIPNAVNIPLDEIDGIAYAKDETIILYCQTGVRSDEAAAILVKDGYTSIYVLDGGLLNWGGDLEEGK